MNLFLIGEHQKFKISKLSTFTMIWGECSITFMQKYIIFELAQLNNLSSLPKTNELI